MTDFNNLRIAIAPMEVPANTFVRSFSRSLVDSGFDVSPYNYQTELAPNTHAVILHWPDQFFSEQTEERTRELDLLLQTWRDAKRRQRTRLIWVAHNIQPHDAPVARSGLAERFIATLDGIIYFSERSRELTHEAYAARVCRELVCPHGHYREERASSPKSPPPIWRGVKLGCFGKIRPYKGIETLIGCATALSGRGVTLTVTGWIIDDAYAATLEVMAAAIPGVKLDLRSLFLSEAELESVVDEVHGVILPYRNIVNSGSVIFALSRNRPVLAPRLGSLPEVQGQAGKEWLYLYESQLKPSVLQSFVDHLLGFSPERFCDLSAFGWAEIGQKLKRFITEVCSGG